MNRRQSYPLSSALVLIALAACSANDGGNADAGSASSVGRATEPAEMGAVDVDDAENPVVFGYEVHGPAGTTAVLVSTVVTQAGEQQLTATWSITDRPRWQLYTNWVESGEIEIEVTEGGPATVRIIRARPVDPDDPFAGIEEHEEVATVEVASGATGKVGFP